MATIVKNPTKNNSVRWKALIRIKGFETVSKTFRTKRDAEDWARRVEDQMVRGVYIQRAPAEKTTLKIALDKYIEEVSPLKSAKTHRGEKSKAIILKEYLGQRSLAGITSDVVADFRDKRLAEGKSKNTVRLELALLSHLFTTAIQEWRLGLVYNPVNNIRKPSVKDSERDRILTPDEEKRLLKVSDGYSNPMLGWIVRIALNTSMRLSEITYLERKNLNLKNRTVVIYQTKNGETRTVPLNKEATRVFELALANPLRPKDCELMFFGNPGKDEERRPYVFNKAWGEILKKAKIKNFTFHDLRHCAVTKLVKLDLTDQEVASISGHKSMQMLKRYTHLRAEDLVSKLD